MRTRRPSRSPGTTRRLAQCPVSQSEGAAPGRLVWCLRKAATVHMKSASHRKLHKVVLAHVPMGIGGPHGRVSKSHGLVGGSREYKMEACSKFPHLKLLYLENQDAKCTMWIGRLLQEFIQKESEGPCAVDKVHLVGDTPDHNTACSIFCGGSQLPLLGSSHAYKRRGGGKSRDVHIQGVYVGVGVPGTGRLGANWFKNRKRQKPNGGQGHTHDRGEQAGTNMGCSEH